MKIRNTISFFFFTVVCASLVFISCQPGMDSTPVSVSREAQPSPVAMPAGAALFSSECSKCHRLRRALNTFRDEKTWIDTITRMQKQNKAQLTGKQIEELVRYHVARQKKENEVFHSKCEKCHLGNRYVEKALTPEQARTVIRRMQQKAGNTIRDEDVELIVNYHIREHQVAVKKNLSNALGIIKEEGPALDTEVLNLFVRKCTSCHEPEVALNVVKSKLAWKMTVRKMQAYSRGFITHEDVAKLVVFLYGRQKTEQQIFTETCTSCHSSERIAKHSLSDEDWLKIVKRMQAKAPDLITEDKIKIITSYHRTHEAIMTALFYEQCDQCHYFGDTPRNDIDPGVRRTRALNTLVTLANEKFAGEISRPEIRDLMQFHVERQKREMEVFKQSCSSCHPPDLPMTGIRDRKEWAMLIATLQDKLYDTKTGDSINTQINFHIETQHR
jgi:mono/diheme cytochrome c family protein